MFNLFGKKDDRVSVKDIIWVSSEAKWKAVIDLWKKDENTIFVFWFDGSMQKAREFLSRQITPNITLVTAKEIHCHDLANKPLVLTEH